MRLALAAGIAAAGLAFSALAQDMPSIDNNQDGWITRAEAADAATRIFAELDSNHDNKLDETDRAAHHETFQFNMSGADVADEHAQHAAGHGEQRIDRRVIIRRSGDGEEIEDVDIPDAPHPPMHMMAHPPMFVMALANSEEFDANHDGALSLDEFRTQQLRFFDAGDGNGDGRVRFSPPPEPPMPPEPPEPPAPPAPPRHR